MTGESKMELPASGLAEEILSSFMVKAQEEIDEAAGRGMVEEQRETHHLVAFGLGQESYGVAIKSVQEIIRPAGITHVPGAPPHVRGVINLRGRIIPVVDLRRRFGLPEVESCEEQRVMVVDLGAKRLGILVDSVSQVIKVPAALVDEVPEEAVATRENFIRGVGKLEEKLVFILDLGRTLLLTP